ncbi:MAG: hypothetical protein AB4352_07110 [Hormoscilla sp.]
MSTSNQSSNLLGKFASIVGLLAAALYFTGWIYRWVYFGFFQVEVTSFELPIESFFLVPIQVFFGKLEFGTLFRTIGALILTPLLIKLTLGVIQFVTTKPAIIFMQWRWTLSQWSLNQGHRRITRLLQRLPQVQPISYDRTFWSELVVVAWVLTVLFLLARTQGSIDARRDAVNDTSTLPVITLVSKEDSLGLGRQLNDETIDPSAKNFRVIGDRGLYEKLIGRELNNTTDSSSSDIIVWRLLIYSDSQFYIFPTLPKDAPSAARPPVVVIKHSARSNQLMILSPEPSPPK